MADRTQRAIWTALPTGRDGSFLTLTALVSPRLIVLNAPSAELRSWPDFAAWATRVANARFTVSFAGVQVEAQLMSAPDPAVWEALLTPQTVVHSHRFEDKRGERILSYPVAVVHDFVARVYGDLGLEVSDELPAKRDVLRHVRELISDADDGDRDLQADVLERLEPSQREAFAGPRGAFTLEEVYHMPLAALDPKAGRHVKTGPDDARENAHWRQHRLIDMPKPNELADRIDFHAIVSALNQYPRLLRRTGLAVDLRIEASRVPTRVTDRLAVQVTWNPTSEVDSGVETLADGAPATITRCEDTLFAAAMRSSAAPLSNGLLDIDENRFRLIQMDVDGAGIKLRNMSTSFERAPSMPEDENPERAGVPTIRTAGLQLVEIDRHVSLDSAFTRSGEMNDALDNGQPIDLYGEDLVRGYHADVIDHTVAGPWRSLCRRDVTYHLLNTGVVLAEADEEGIIRLGAQEAADPSDPKFQHLTKIGELLFSWAGWSLTVPRVGLAIGADDQPQAAANTAPPRLPLETTFSVVHRSLPALRFGHEYRVRMRLVDLAGNAIPLLDDDTSIADEASDPHVYRRFEPVLPPANALVRTARGVERPYEGESMARLAIRSMNMTEADNAIPTVAETRRHVVPPRSSQVMIEQHGLLDHAPSRPDPALYAMIAGRDVDLAEVGVRHEDPLTGSDDRIGYSVAPEQFATPYLPDALARAAAIRLDFEPDDQKPIRVEVPYYGDTSWPNAEPFQVRLFEDPTAAVAFDASTRMLDVPLAKAEAMRLRISHTLESKDLDLMAIWALMKERPGMTPDLEEVLRDVALRGEHWMFTPWLEMELIHAVQKPLTRPSFLSLAASRGLGETAATITFRSPIHAKSTDKVELLGRWREPSDIVLDGAPRVLNQSGSAFDTRLTRSSFPNGVIRTSGPHEFGDTRYRRVAYRLEAPTRFREFMPAAIRQQPNLTTVASDDGVALVPNGAPPPAPEVEEIVPTFGWSRTRRGNQVLSFRSGGGLRVWLRRPWFATGFGEMLGVLVSSAGTPPDHTTGPGATFVTQWGVDPIWRSGDIDSASPPVDAFPDRLLGGPIDATRSPGFVPDEERNLPSPLPRLTNLALPESGGVHVDVAAHPVCFDHDRDLYYCDIRVDPGRAYYPFVRLALARFHPISCDDAHLSPAVLADYMQLAPDRLLIMTRTDRSSERKVQLFGHRYSHSSRTDELSEIAGRPILHVEIQRKDPALSGPLAWFEVEESPFDPDTLHAALAVEHAPVMRADAADIAGEVSDLTAANLDRFLRLTPPLMWETTFQLPLSPRGEERRILVIEYERHIVDSDRGPLADDAPDPSLRIIYAETIPL